MRVGTVGAVLALAVGSAASTRTSTPAATVISGVVFDSLAMRGLSGATVQIADASGKAWTQTDSTDATGRFEFRDVPVGTYLLGYFHPKLDSLSLSGQTVRIDVRSEQPVSLRLAVPSSRTIARAMCGPKAVTDSTGLWLGMMRSAENSMPHAGGQLAIRWAEILIERNSIRRISPAVDVTASATGQFAVCGVPVGTPLLVHAGSGPDSSGVFEVTLDRAGLLHRDVYIGPVTRQAVAVSDSAPPVDLLRGAGGVRGRVLGTNRLPVASARVSLWGTGIETTTDSEGRFTLTNLPSGTHTLEVKAVGFSPVQQPVDIVLGVPGVAAVELANLGITLDTIRVTTRRVYTSAREADFERRLRSGHGHLIDETEIEKRRPSVLTDLLRTVPGVQVLPGRRSGYDVFMRGGLAILGNGLCRPDMMIDGVRVTNDADLPVDASVSISDIRAVEVYAHPSVSPAEYSTLSGCGIIAVWTGARRK